MANQPYHDALMRRLGIIKDMGESYNANYNPPQQYSSGMGLNSFQPTSSTVRLSSNYAASPGNNFSNFMHAIVGRESGGNYNARNPTSGALGKYQIMPGNIASWSREALGRSISPQQFYRSPTLQDQIAQYKLRQYYNQWGPAGAAVAWYAGPGNAQKWMASGGAGAHFNRPQGKYSSISAYAYGILKAMGLR